MIDVYFISESTNLGSPKAVKVIFASVQGIYKKIIIVLSCFRGS